MKDLSKIKQRRYFLLLGFLLMLTVSLAAKADDNEEGYVISNQSALPVQSSVQLAQTNTVTSTKVVTLNDSDGDGLLDADDPHPNIAEIYIVADEDNNGIVDSFEK
jgi:hypothetical protein